MATCSPGSNKKIKENGRSGCFSEVFAMRQTSVFLNQAGKTKMLSVNSNYGAGKKICQPLPPRATQKLAVLSLTITQ